MKNGIVVLGTIFLITFVMVAAGLLADGAINKVINSCGG